MKARGSEVFVGRTGELGELERALEATRAGTGETVLVAGEAGIGKTRLASELTGRARSTGFEVLVGRSIDLVGTELPYQPFAEALRPLGKPWRAGQQAAGSQLRVFEETLVLLTERAASAPVLLVLEDLHWADTSTLDLVVFLAHNLHERPVLLLATCRADDPTSANPPGQHGPPLIAHYAVSSSRPSGPSSSTSAEPERRTPSASLRMGPADAGSSARQVASSRTGRS
jgi:hypothetical protein